MHDSILPGNGQATDLVINVADIWLEEHRGVVILMQEGKGFLTLSDAAMDA